MSYTPYKMKGSPMQRNFGIGSPAKKALVGNQANLPEELKAKIDASPAKQTKFPNSPKAKERKMLKAIKSTKFPDGPVGPRPDFGPTVDIRKKKDPSKVAENKRQLDAKYNGPRSKGGLLPRDKSKGPRDGMKVTSVKKYSKKSPAKCPLVAALAPAVIGAVGGMIKKKKEE